MDLSLKVALLLLGLAALFALYLRWRSSYRAPTRHPRVRSKGPSTSYQETNAAAGLLTDVLALKGRGAQWPEIIKTLNPEDQPHIRTVLLELRGPHVFAPHTALNIIENVCMTVTRPNDHLTRLDLLEMAKKSMDRVTRYGD